MEKDSDKVKILGASAVKAKLKRMAYEVYEANFGKDSLVIVGIDKRGGFLAKCIAELLKEISPLAVEMTFAKKIGGGRVRLEGEKLSNVLTGKTVLVVDDVLYSGHTMLNAVAEVLSYSPAKVQTAVLIDRGHRNVPVTHDFVGMLLATSLKQHVSVEVQESKASATAYLT